MFSFTCTHTETLYRIKSGPYNVIQLSKHNWTGVGRGVKEKEEGERRGDERRGEGEERGKEGRIS